MIEVNNLTKRFGYLTAIEGLSFGVGRGEILGLLGPNGAGKTTTMKILTGFLSPSDGSVKINGLEPGRDPVAARRLIGYLPETVPLYADMFIDEYLAFVARIKGVSNPAAQIDEAVTVCKLEDVFRRQIKKLSKGYRQRAGLAQALLGDPEVLILDEPTIGLDPNQIVEVRNLIRSLEGRKTVILSTHILPEVSQTCSRVVIIADGRVVAEDTTAALTSRGEGGMELALRVAGPAAAAGALLDRLDGIEVWRAVEESDGQTLYSLICLPERDIRAELARAVVEAGLELLELRALEMSLEDVFVRLVREEEGNRA